jgi:YVTN family beta-propeller protein
VTAETIRIEKGVALYAAVSPKTNLIYLSYPISNFILVADLTSRSFRQQLYVDSPGNIAINSVTNRIYVSSADGIYDIDGSTGEFHVIKKSSSLHTGSVAINPVTNTLYTASFKSDVVSVINAETYSEIDEISVGKNPQGMAVNPNANTIYVANSDSESISVIDVKQSNKVVDTMKVNGFSYSKLSMKPTFLQINELSNLLYAQATKAC